MSQAETDNKNLAFDGRIQLNGDAAPELEVIVELTDEFIILGHTSGELGRWDKNAVQVAPIGRGWFTLNVEEETVTFLPRRPGHFAASTVDLVPVETAKKRWWQRSKTVAKPEATPALTRKERKRREKEEAAGAAAAPADVAVDFAPPAPEPAPPAVPSPEQTAPAPTPVERPVAPAAPEPAPAPEVYAPAPPVQSPAEPASPWDDVPIPEIPGRKPKEKKRSRTVPESVPRPDPARKDKAPREKAPKPPKPARVKETRGRAVELAGASRPVSQAGPKKKNALSKAFAGFWHGLKGILLRVSDELRQTGIVPFDRLPAAPARSRPSESHQHAFEEHRLPGGLTRNVCHSCGLVSIGGSGDDE